MRKTYRHDDSDDSDYDDDDDEHAMFALIANSIKRQKREPSKEEVLKQKVRTNKHIPPTVQDEACKRLDNISSDAAKVHEWVENLLRIPFGVYKKLPVTKKSSKKKLAAFFEEAENKLEQAVYGMKTVKEEVLNYLAQFISTQNTNARPRVLGLCGSAGVGKTAIIRKGFSEALDRPMECISMGGMRDSSHFLGHDFTYIGSRFGILIQSVMKMGCMNGILFFDEVDKVSTSCDGSEIQHLLLHLTDPEQSHTFHDKYFAGIDFDLSKLIFVFSFNHEELIDPILRDRIHIIKVPDPTLDEKVVIGQQYLLRDARRNVGFADDDIHIEPDVIRYIVKEYCGKHKGVRALKKCLETIVLKINAARMMGPTMIKYNSLKAIKGIKLPFTVSQEVVSELLKDCKEPQDQYVASMYL
jgi:ATP-dependent Lon protease